MLQTKPKALLIDITRCIGCKACVGACMEAHGLTGDPDKVVGLSARSLTALTKHGDLNVRELCRHCLTPSCASVCPVKAFTKTAAGPVVATEPALIWASRTDSASRAWATRANWLLESTISGKTRLAHTP